MNIKLKGLATMPDEYESENGQLSASLNLLNEDGAVRPVRQPQVRMNFVPSAEGGRVRVLAIHKIGGTISNCIVESNGTVRWVPLSVVSEYSVAFDRCTLIGDFEDLLDLKIHGNILVIATGEGLRYAIWRNGGYDLLPEEKPFIDITFALNSQSRSNFRGNYRGHTIIAKIPCHFAERPGNISYIPSQEDMELNTKDRRDVETDAYAALHNGIRGAFNKYVNDARASGMFLHPFFARYAVKLYDGSYIWHSAPVLMLPSFGEPLVVRNRVNWRPDDLQSEDNGYTEITLDVSAFRPAKLQFSIPYINEAYQTEWEGIISSIDIFVSAPIYSYVENEEKIQVENTVCMYWRNKPQGFFLGHYGVDGADYRPRYQTETLGGVYPGFKEKENWIQDIKDNCNFYLLGSIALKDLKETDGLVDVPLDNKDLTNITTRRTLPDEYLSHSELVSDFLKVYNSRTHLVPDKIIPPKPFHLNTLLPYDSTLNTTTTTICVYMIKSGVICKSERTVTGVRFEEDPFWLYYPDPNAFKMTVRIGSESRSYPLSSHGFLNGSYYFKKPLTTDDIYQGEGEAPEPAPQFPYADYDLTHTFDRYSWPNKVFASEVDNPFLFPAKNIVTVGTSKVVALESAAKALSQGQFGQFPLYAFTDEGVWALEVSATGIYSARQPITRDVCVSPRSITQIDSSVLFPTSRGIMELSGSIARPLTDIIVSPGETNVMPGLANVSDVESVGPLSLMDYIQGCQMSYDYKHQRLVVFNEGYAYALVYSFKSQAWGMIDNLGYYFSVPSYPDACVMLKDANYGGVNRMVSFAGDYNDAVKGLLVTRALKLGESGSRATVRGVMARGVFEKGHVQTVLYGSNDLKRWHLVRSSARERLTGFSGTPYRYFRVALLTRLEPGESVDGLSIEARARKVNEW